MADNIGSWRVLEKCGMRRVRTFYYPDADLMPGAEHGDFVYELTGSNWTGQVKHERRRRAVANVRWWRSCHVGKLPVSRTPLYSSHSSAASFILLTWRMIFLPWDTATAQRQGKTLWG